MHVGILGAGVAGVTTAYYLAQLGCRVTVLDRAGEAGSGASGDNGGQLSYSHTDAMASPRFLLKLPGLVAGRDPAVLFRPGLEPGFLRWGMSFLGQCTPGRSRDNTLEVLRMALRSAVLMRKLQESVPFDFSFRPAGKLVMISGERQLRAARQSVEAKQAAGCRVEMLSLGQACEVEPALARFRSGYVGAVWSPRDEVGDTRAFTVGLRRWLEEHREVVFRMGTQVRGLEVRAGNLEGIQTNRGTVTFDATVVCLGAWSPALLAPHRTPLNIYPVRGYSITMPAGEAPATVSITDQGSRIVFSRIGDSVRVAGFADFLGFDRKRDRQRIAQLRATAQSIAPEIADYTGEELGTWGGFRPMTPHSRPLVGPTTVKGLFLNTGHGMLGWTLACATAERVAHIAVGRDSGSG